MEVLSDRSESLRMLLALHSIKVSRYIVSLSIKPTNLTRYALRLGQQAETRVSEGRHTGVKALIRRAFCSLDRASFRYSVLRGDFFLEGF